MHPLLLGGPTLPSTKVEETTQKAGQKAGASDARGPEDVALTKDLCLVRAQPHLGCLLQSLVLLSARRFPVSGSQSMVA